MTTLARFNGTVTKRVTGDFSSLPLCICPFRSDGTHSSPSLDIKTHCWIAGQVPFLNLNNRIATLETLDRLRVFTRRSTKEKSRAE